MSKNIGILSDIHVDINYSDDRDRVTPAICDFIDGNGIDIFITAGDISGDFRITLDVIERIEAKTGKPCYFTPGNHDLWNEKTGNYSTWDAYNALKTHPSNLANGPVRLDDRWVILGDVGWYNYSFGNSRFSHGDYESKSYNERVWQDSLYAKWDRPTIEMHDWFLKKIEDDLDKTGDSSVIIVTHMLPIPYFTVPTPHETWDYFNAFLGSRELGSLIERFPNIKYSICGHVHYRKEIKQGNTTYICNCLGYNTEWADTDDPMVEIPNAMKIITI